ncbi:hypothetical protein ACM9XD_16465 [Xanthomonas sacchari]
MRLKSEVLAELLEPTLFGLQRPNGERIGKLLSQARAALLRASDMLQMEGREPDRISYELGVATTFTQLLATADQRQYLNDVIARVKDIKDGVQTLHEIALIGRSAPEPTQRELATLLNADRGNFNRRITLLEQVGVVESRRSGQSRVYAMTDLGLDVLGELQPGWRAVHPSRSEMMRTEAETKRVASEIATTIIRGCEFNAGGSATIVIPVASFALHSEPAEELLITPPVASRRRTAWPVEPQIEQGMAMVA